MLKHYRVRDYNFKLVIMVIALAVIGIIAVGSAEEALQKRQIFGFAFGLFLMVVLSLFDYAVILKFYWAIYAFNVVLLLLVILMGDKGGGAQRWLEIAGFRFQPSEIAKIFIILFFAQFIMKRKETLNTFQNICLCVVLFAIPAVLVFKQPDLSTTIIICLIFCTIMFVGGLSWKIILGIFSVAIPAAIILITLILRPDRRLLTITKKIES